MAARTPLGSETSENTEVAACPALATESGGCPITPWSKGRPVELQ
jgi:hypothetical protein